jgi:Protein of unknown function (DUF3592)
MHLVTLPVHPFLAAELPFFFTHLMPWTLMLVGAWTTFGALNSLLQAVASYRWPSTHGTVTRAEVNESLSGGSNVDYSVRKPDLEYSYQVDGRVTLIDRPFRSEGQAAAFLNRYPKGAAVTVHFHPKDFRCSMRPGLCLGHFTGFFFPLLFLGSGVFLFRVVPGLHHFQ